MEIKDLLEKIQSTNVEDSKLYFVTRLLKEGIKKNAKMIDKYIFKIYQIDIDDEIRQYLYDCSQEELQRVIKKDYQLLDYDVISDDTEHLFTYKINNKALPFQDIVRNKLSSNPPKAQSIAGILSDDEELWAYCIGFNDVENSDWIYTFRKIQPSKIVVDEEENAKTLFST